MSRCKFSEEKKLGEDLMNIIKFCLKFLRLSLEWDLNPRHPPFSNPLFWSEVLFQSLGKSVFSYV